MKMIERFSNRDNNAEREVKARHWKDGYNRPGVSCRECSGVSYEHSKSLLGSSETLVLCKKQYCCNK